MYLHSKIELKIQYRSGSSHLIISRSLMEDLNTITPANEERKPGMREESFGELFCMT